MAGRSWQRLQPGTRRAILGALVLLWSADRLSRRFWASDTALWRRIAEIDPGNAAAFDW